MRQVAPHRRQGGTLALSIRQRSIRRRYPQHWVQAACKEPPMLDLVMLALGLAFFALSVGYTVACDRL
jgi:hypothetical protein